MSRKSRAVRDAMARLNITLREIRATPEDLPRYTWQAGPADAPLFLDELNRSPNVPRCTRCGGPLGPVGECILCD